jgi:transglutaminase-like putative cysteine protease
MDHAKETVKYTCLFRPIHVLLCLACVFSLFSCEKKINPLETALRFAGDNRSVLGKVLQHYSIHPEDSLKYRAAAFLIENMPEYFSYRSETLDTFSLEIRDFGVRNEWTVIDNTMRVMPAEMFSDKYASIPSVGNADIVFDAHVITSSYLINNIEEAFETWENVPWGEQISFEVFCREILPYRVGNEPLEDWRAAYKERYSPLLTEMRQKEDAVEVARSVYDSIYWQRWIFDNAVHCEYIGGKTLFDSRVGDCKLLAHYAVYALRALGIPAGIDCILQNPNMMYQHHYWNYMRDPNGRTIPFELYQTPPGSGPNTIPRKKGKVYRICFDTPVSDLTPFYRQGLLPPPLNNPHLTDVSKEYFEGAIVDIEPSEGNVVYLGVFNNRTWVPITCASVIGGVAHFEGLEPGIVWQALVIHENKLVPASVPFVSEYDGTCRFLYPDITKPRDLCVDRKYPMPGWYASFRHRAIGGRFEGANVIDFSDATLLHTTVDSLDMRWHRAVVTSLESFRYLRYYAAYDSHCNIAEIRFFSSGKPVTGDIIGTEGSSNHTVTMSKTAVFDGADETFFDSASPDGSWVGLKLNEPSRVTDIEYIFRTDDNYVRRGDEYELLYFSDRGAISLGRQIGDSTLVLKYGEAPEGALYWLRNHTRGQEERPFTIENGAQRFW